MACYVGFVLLGIGVFFAFLISTPWITLAVCGLAYLASIPYAATLHKQFERERPSQTEIDERISEDEDETD